MNKILRYSFVALLAMIMGKVIAQEVTIDFTLTDPADEKGKTSIWGFPAGSSNKTVEEKSFTYNGLTVKVAGSESQGYYWHDKDHYLLFGKEGATLTLPAFEFDVERIDIEGTSGASTGIKQNIFVGDEAVSTETKGAKDVTNEFVIAEGKQAAGTIYTIKVTSNHNNQIKTIKIWKKGTSPNGQDTPTVIQEINVAKALDIISGMENAATSAEEYKVKGFVVGDPDFQRKADGTLYGNVNFVIADTKGGTSTLTIYRAKSFDNQNFTEETITSLKADDEVVLQGVLKKYVKDDVVTPELVNCYLISVNNTTGIKDVKANELQGTIYNLAGQRVDNVTKGIYIQNGKKFVVK